MKPDILLKRAKDLQSILLPARDMNLNHNLADQTKNMLIEFFSKSGEMNNNYLRKTISINTNDSNAYIELCDLLSSYIKEIENDISVSNK